VRLECVRRGCSRLRRALATPDDIALTTTLVTDSCDRLLLYTLDTDDDMIHDDTIVNDDGQGSPDRVGSSAAEGGASVAGGLEVGVGVGGSRLPPHPKPPAHNNPLAVLTGSGSGPPL